MDIEKQIKELNKQLYPTGRAWGYVHGSEQVNTAITEFVDGLGNPFVDGFGNAFVSISSSEASPSKRLVNAFLKSYERLYEDAFSILNQILADNENFDETDATNWERIFGLSNIGLTLDERKTNILRKQSYPNGVAERGHFLFVQDQLQAAGFNVNVIENRFTDGAGGWNVVDPNDQTDDITNSVFSSSFNFNSQDSSATGLFIKNDGTLMYVIGNNTNTVYTYQLTTSWDISTAVYTGDSFSIASQINAGQEIYISDNGLYMFITNLTDNTVYKYIFGTPWQLNTLGYSGQSYDITPQGSSISGVWFNLTGEKMYISATTSQEIYEYDLATAYDLSTLAYNSNKLDISAIPSPKGISLDGTGNNLYVIGEFPSAAIFQYKLSTAYDLTTAVLFGSFSLSPEGTFPKYLYMKSDKSTYYVVEDTGNNVNQYNNTEAYSIVANNIDENIDAKYFDILQPLTFEFGTMQFGLSEFGNAEPTTRDEKLRATFYIGGATIPTKADVPIERKDEFRELILKLKPAQTVAFLYINYI